MALVVGGLSTLLTGCDDYGDDWSYGPPPTWGSNWFYDTRLNGDWELIQANGQAVTPNETSYMYFYGGGQGTRYYLQGGQQMSMAFKYYCQDVPPSATTSRNKINVRYADRSASTMAYWFSEHYSILYLQWQVQGSGQMVTYTYRKVQSTPW